MMDTGRAIGLRLVASTRSTANLETQMMRFMFILGVVGLTGRMPLVQAAQGAKAPPAQPAPALPDWARDSLKKDPISRWDVTARGVTAEAKGCEIHVVNMDWGGLWEHKLQVVSPVKATADDLCVIFIGGGVPSALGSLGEAAKKLNVTCAGLGGIPCKSFGQVGEAGLLMGTLKYLQTHDSTFITFVPMVRAVERAMDAIQELAPKELGKPVRRFILVGHSKAGGTAWWAAAIDPRVVGIVPIGADLLNVKAQAATYETVDLKSFMPKEMQEQMPGDAWEQISEVTDPYPLRSRLTMPKLIIQGANDEHFVTGATRFYFDDLPGEKWVLNLPNATHGGSGDAGEVPNSATGAAIAAFITSIATARPLPQVTWTFKDAGDKLAITFSAADEATQLLLWTAENSSQDFRYRPWSSRTVTADFGDNVWIATAEVAKPAAGFVAAFVSAQFERDGRTFWLSSLIHVSKR